MSKKLMAVCIFVFGMGLGAGASAGGASITPEMAQCIYECKLGGGTQTYCWACCVNGHCLIPEPIE